MNTSEHNYFTSIILFVYSILGSISTSIAVAVTELIITFPRVLRDLFLTPGVTWKSAVLRYPMCFDVNKSSFHSIAYFKHV